MAVDNKWRNPATRFDDDYKIDVTTLAPLAELTKGNTFETTGKEDRGSEYKDIIRSDELTEGITIIAEDSKEDKTK